MLQPSSDSYHHPEKRYANYTLQPSSDSFHRPEFESNYMLQPSDGGCSNYSVTHFGKEYRFLSSKELFAFDIFFLLQNR